MTNNEISHGGEACYATTLGSLSGNEKFIAVRMLIADVRFSPAHAQRVGNHSQLEKLEIMRLRI